MSAPTRTNADTARLVYEVFGAGDIPGLLELLAPDVAWESDWEDNFAQRPGGPAFYRPFTGRDHLDPFFQAMGANEFSMLEVRDVIADGDRVVCRVALEYTLPGGGRYRDEQLHLWTFDERGAISSIRHFLDTAKLLAAAGGEDTTERVDSGFFRFLDAWAAVRVDAAATQGRMAVIEFRAVGGHGSPVRIHEREDQGYLVLEGVLEFRTGDRAPVRHGRGGFAWATRGETQSYTVVSPTARWLCLVAPAGLEGMFRELGAPASADLPAGGVISDAEADRAGATVGKYGLTIVGPPTTA